MSSFYFLKDKRFYWYMAYKWPILYFIPKYPTMLNRHIYVFRTQVGNSAHLNLQVQSYSHLQQCMCNVNMNCIFDILGLSHHIFFRSFLSFLSFFYSLE